MKKSSVIFTAGMFCLVSLFFFGGCAKKTVLREDAVPNGSQAVAKATPQGVEKSIKEQEEVKRRVAEEQSGREAAAKAKAEKEAAKKQAAASKVVSAKELYEITDIHFDFDKFSLRDDARDVLNKHAEWLKKNKDVKIVIEGHCDEKGSAEYNLALGERRASSAAKYMEGIGVDAKRIKTISYGFEKPLDPGHNEAAWSTNRRANFLSEK